MTDQTKKAPDEAPATQAEGKPPERPDRPKRKDRPRPSDRLGYFEDFLPSD